MKINSATRLKAAPTAVTVVKVYTGTYAVDPTTVLYNGETDFDLIEELGDIDTERISRLTNSKVRALLTKALKAGSKVWLACGYESDTMVILKSAPKKLKGPDDSKEFSYGTPVVLTGGAKALMFVTTH